MKYNQDHPIWAVIKNAYTHNDQPILFLFFNLFLIIAIAIVIYSAYKWKTESKDYRFMTIFASVLCIIFIGFMLLYLINSDNKVGKYEGTVDIAFTSKVKDSKYSIARFSKQDEDKSSNGLNSFVMKTSDMDNLDIKSGKTVSISSKNQPAPSEEKSFAYLDKDDIKNVTDSKKVSNYNKTMEDKEEQEKKEKEKKEKEKKEKAKKKDKK
ncbi:TPA: hypothetical protein PRL34_001991 [Staphylococcus aureus]|nr:hypothetical protein [Staphylococcus aureus]